MNIIYYLDSPTELYARLLQIAVNSAKRVSPGDSRIIYLHPDWAHVPRVKGIDKELMIAGIDQKTHWAYRRMIANASVPAGDNLFLDVDIIMQKDISEIFAYDFDIAVAKRDKFAGEDLPYNGGVCFCRVPEFWKHCALGFNKYTFNWKEVEQAFSRTLAHSEYRVKELNGHFYNRTADGDPAKLEDAYLLHYKGPRKNKMLAREKEFST